MRRLLLLLLTCFTSCALAQERAYIEQDSVAVTHFKLKNQQQLYTATLYFPYDGGNKGVNIASLPASSNQYYLAASSPVPVSAATRIQIPVFYTSNVKSFTVVVSDAEGKTYAYVHKLNGDGYQPGIISPLVQNPSDEPGLTQKPVFCKVEAVNPQRPTQFIVSDLTIADFYKRAVVSPLPFFKRLFPYNAEHAARLMHPIFRNAQSNFDWLSVEFCQSPIFINAQAKPTDENQLLYKLLKACLAEYPFYAEKSLAPHRVLEEFESISVQHSTRPISELAQAYQGFLRKTFHDGHFKIELTGNKSKAKSVGGPVRISKINGDYYVSAVLDTLLERKIPLGSRVLRINGRKIETLVDSFIQHQYTKAYAARRDQLVHQDICRELTTFNEGAEVSFDFRTADGNLQTVSTVYQKRYALKPNFANVHCEYKSINSDISYFKFNVFDELPVLRLQSIIDSISHKQLILDIRSNGGGDIAYLDDFLSFFVYDKRLQIFSGTSRDGALRDSVFVLNENPHKLKPSAKLVVLVDSKTACTAELFIHILKKYNKNVTVIGSDNTSGTLANAFSIVLPSKEYSLIVNAPEVFNYHLGFPLEDIGITPDIKVEIESVLDLKPYQDKVLRTGIDYLTNSTHRAIPIARSTQK